MSESSTMSESSRKILIEMEKGFSSLDVFADNLPLGWSQLLKVKATKLVINLYRILVLPFQKNKKKQLEEQLKAYQDLTIDVQRTNLQATPDNNYLTEVEIQQFEQTGVVFPFPVVSPEEAAKLAQEAKTDFDNHPENQSYLGADVEAAMRKYDLWNINIGGLYQALRLKSFRKLLQRPPIAHRLASLLGEEVLCWRSQFFEKKPGDIGTFWHQNSVFRETEKDNKLVPTKETSLPIIQLTVWVALSDVTVKNGALRMMPSTFKDGRIEFMYTFAQDNLIYFLSQAPSKELDKLLKIAFFSTGSFLKVQGIFNILTHVFPNLFKGGAITDLEMKAGEAVIFTSLNMHASYPNTTTDDTRLAYVGRCVGNHVKVNPYSQKISYSTPEGEKECTIPAVNCFQVHGKDSFHHNRIMEEEDGSIPHQ